jgi:hypothetical protein
MDNMTKLIKMAAIWAVAIFLSLPLFAQPELSASDEVSRTGYFQLKWKSGENGQFVLQQDTTSLFTSPKTLYSGPDTARTVSGLLNGEYYYRVRAAEGEWSEPLMVTVEHYKLSTAFIFLGLGAVVFLATATLIIRGHITHRKTHGNANG